MWDLYKHAMIMSTLLNSAEFSKVHVLIEDEQKQSYSKNLAQQDSVISVGQILHSTANKCLIRNNRNKYTHETYTPQ